MILREFPDIDWLKKQAQTNFADRKGVRGVELPEKGWPSVVMNARSSGTERKDIAGPFSIFLNLSGKSTIRTEGKHFHVHTDTYCITNKGRHYDLIIPDKSNTTRIAVTRTVNSNVILFLIFKLKGPLRYSPCPPGYG